MTASSYPPPPKVRDGRFDDWLFRFWKGLDMGTLAGQWTPVPGGVYRPTGHVGVGAAPPSGQSSSLPMLFMGAGTVGFTSLFSTVANAYYDGSNWKRISTGLPTAYNHNGATGAHVWYTSVTGAAGSTISFIEAARLKATRELVCNPSYINVRQYGALGDGSTDDTTAISNALTDAATNAMRRVYFPRGTYRITTALTIAGDFTLFGDGSSASIIKVDGAINGIVHTGNLNTLENEKLTIQHLGLRSNNSGAGSAIKGTWTVVGGGAALPACLISDVEISASSSSAAFAKGIDLASPGYGVIENVTVYGLESGTIASGSYGIYIDGGSSYGTDVKIRDCVFHYVETGVYCVDVEGVHFNRNTFQSCLDGIKAETTITAGKPYLDIVGNHFNVGRYGIHVIEMVQFVIGDNLIYGDQRTPTAGTTFIGVRLEAGSNGSGTEMQSIVRDNMVLMVNESVGGYTTANYGYAVYGGSGTVESVIFKGNKAQGCDTLIYLDSSTTGAVITEDNIGTSGELWSDNGTGNSTPKGAYTPTGYTVTNITTVTPYEATWTRTGDVVTVYGDVDLTATSANALTTFRLSIPVPSDMGAATQLNGVMCPSGVNAPGGAAQAHTATSPDRVEFNYYAVSTGATRFSYSYRYRVS